MADLLAFPEDIAALYGDISTVEARVDSFLRFASSLARSKSPGLDARILAGTVDADVVRDVVVSAVVRALRNPAGIKSEAAGPFSVSYDSQVSAGYVFFTDDELALLGATATLRRQFGTVTVRARW